MSAKYANFMLFMKSGMQMQKHCKKSATLYKKTANIGDTRTGVKWMEYTTK